MAFSYERGTSVTDGPRRACPGQPLEHFFTEAGPARYRSTQTLEPLLGNEPYWYRLQGSAAAACAARADASSLGLML